MPEQTRAASGRPGWIDLASPHPETARTFYRALFGWDSYTLSVPGYGDYTVFTLGDVQGPEVAGMQSLVDDSQPPSWTCYFEVGDLQRAADAVKAGGGRELIPPSDYGGVGSMALCMDPEGADFGVAVPGNLIEFGTADRPGAMCWVELACRDIEGARRFYHEVFGWEAVDRDYHGSVYTNWKLGDWSVGGMISMDDSWPPNYPPHWIPYFWVDDCDAAAARAVDLGATIRIQPADIQPGRYATMTDPTGARLAVITPRIATGS
ncbi:VOC family protein [Actinomadura verrucosospora]|uniref:Glyoxalase/bleomycin resistance protein/dioxygenase n=1 Tax=Actinomadura verrucosospora TaxID=46165 RepID=A0A7D3VT46_ACTVE|nr:VOC family protein [Actinomadura verrucosospora]QKG21990.1 glyoxalase/bleomycin resistance protein/dioxygenase [Actinomadura verrucosospora]